MQGQRFAQTHKHPHDGGRYFFAGKRERDLFLAAPERYAAVLSGYDVVAAKDNAIQVAGSRRHGLWFRSRVFLFANEASLETFSQNPDDYFAFVLRVEEKRQSQLR